MAKYCKKTCGTGNADEKTGCEDYKKYCPNKVKRYNNMMKRNCQVTCGICHKAQGEHSPVKFKKYNVASLENDITDIGQGTGLGFANFLLSW